MRERKTLNKTLKPHWVWAIALGSAIGWGAFVQPIDWMQSAGPIGVILGFSIGALLMMLIAVSYGFLIRNFPVTGGEFAYAFISLGRTHAFISGWFLTLGYICIVALNASAFALMFKFVFPKMIENVPLYTIAGWEVYGVEILIATVGLIVFGYLNIKVTGISGKTQFIFAMVIIVSVFILRLFFHNMIENVRLYTIACLEVYGEEILIATVCFIVFGYLYIKGTGISGKSQFIFAMVMVVSVFILTLFLGLQPTAGITNIHPY